MSAESQDPNNKDLIGKLCILDYEMPVSENLLMSFGQSGSSGLDDLFDFNVSYSTTLLSSIPAFYQKQVDFPIIADQVLGTLYKHPRKWKELFEAVKNDPDIVTVYVCPISGVPRIFSSEDTFEILVNNLKVNMKATGLSKLSRITHQNLSEESGEVALEYFRETGFVSSLIENMNDFVLNLFTLISTYSDEAFIDFMQNLVFSKKAAISIDVENGTLEIIQPEEEEGEWSEGDEDRLQDLLESEAEESEDIDGSYLHEGLEESGEGNSIHKDFDISRDDLKNKNAIVLKTTKTIH